MVRYKWETWTEGLGTRQTWFTDDARLRWCRALLFPQCAAKCGIVVTSKSPTDCMQRYSSTADPPTNEKKRRILHFLNTRNLSPSLLNSHRWKATSDRIYAVLVFTKRSGITVGTATRDGNVHVESKNSFT